MTTPSVQDGPNPVASDLLRAEAERPWSLLQPEVHAHVVPDRGRKMLPACVRNGAVVRRGALSGKGRDAER
jgi:hypothetical protein